MFASRHLSSPTRELSSFKGWEEHKMVRNDGSSHRVACRDINVQTKTHIQVGGTELGEGQTHLVTLPPSSQSTTHILKHAFLSWCQMPCWCGMGQNAMAKLPSTSGMGSFHTRFK